MKKEFTQWKNDYGLEFEPNYSKQTELDCKAAFEAGQQSKQKEIDKLKMSNHYLSVQVIDAEAYSEHWKYQRDKLQKRIEDALAVYDRPMCDETALYQRDDDIYHILTEDKFI